MCGIIGYAGMNEAVPILIQGLEKLEYRGYDSAGICINDGQKLKIIKRKGNVSELREAVKSSGISGNYGIAHTRWATHGIPNEINSHPHADSEDRIAVAHNGIIENYLALKDLLLKEGVKFKSDTDSEVLAHLIRKFYAGNLEDAVSKALALVEGTYGLAVIGPEGKKIVAARKGSPLVLGVKDGEMFVASDVTAIINYTNQVIYLKDNEIASLTPEGYSIRSVKGEEINGNIEEIKWNVSQIEKKGFKHFMLKEIYEQPETIENILRGRIKNGNVNLTVKTNFNNVGKIVLVACGTSWHSALIGKYIIEKIARVNVEVDYASEFRYRNPLIGNNDVIVAISQSGETADTLAAIREAKEKGAETIGIINVVGSTISREVDSGIYLHAGPEIGVASTKAFTSQVMALILLALFIMKNKGERIDFSLLEDLNNLSKLAKKVLSESEKIKKIAEKYKNSTNFLYLGRGINFPAALEGALKLKEISYIHAEGYPAAEMKHGPIALIDKNMPVVFLCPKDDTYDKVLSNMEEVKARSGRIIAIINEDDEKVERLADHIIKVPRTNELLSPILNSIPLQLFAYYVADFKGCNVDKPRNLAKSVTVE